MIPQVYQQQVLEFYLNKCCPTSRVITVSSLSNVIEGDNLIVLEEDANFDILEVKGICRASNEKLFITEYYFMSSCYNPESNLLCSETTAGGSFNKNWPDSFYSLLEEHIRKCKLFRLLPVTFK